MGVLKTPRTPKSAIKTPKKGKTPAKNASPKLGTPEKSAKKKGAPTLQVTTPGGTMQALKTPKSAKKQINLNGGTNATPKSAKKGKPQTPQVTPNTPKNVLQANSPKIGKTPKSSKKKSLAPTAASPIVNANAPQSGKKRKASLSNSENTSEESTKLKQFAGTKTLGTSPGKSPPKKQKLSEQPKANLDKQPKGNKKQPKAKQNNQPLAPSATKITARAKHRLLAKLRKLKHKLETETKSEEKAKLEKQIELLMQRKTTMPIEKKTVVSNGNELSKRQKKRAAQNAKKQLESPASDASGNQVAKPSKQQKPTSIAEVVAAKKPVQKQKAKAKPVKKPEPVVDSDEEDSDDDEIDEIDQTQPSEEESDDDEDNSDFEVEKTVKAAKVTKTLAYDPDEADAVISNKKGKKKEANENGKKPKNAKKEKQPAIDPKTLKKEDIIEKGKSRYVVFVGNVPFTADQNELRTHFASAGNIESVRIPKDKDNKARGFAYVELKDSESYEKALSLHQSTFNGRRLNVSYTMSGKKNSENKKNIIKSKNLKLHAMRKSGMLAGSKKDTNNRSARRAKAKAGGGAKGGSE